MNAFLAEKLTKHCFPPTPAPWQLGIFLQTAVRQDSSFLSHAPELVPITAPSDGSVPWGRQPQPGFRNEVHWGQKPRDGLSPNHTVSFLMDWTVSLRKGQISADQSQAGWEQWILIYLIYTLFLLPSKKPKMSFVSKNTESPEGPTLPQELR